MTLEDHNYYSDHRVLASQSKPWYVALNVDNDHAVVKVLTIDGKWLEDNGYDLEEFEDEPTKPMIYAAMVKTDTECRVCSGSGKYYKHKSWPGMCLPFGNPTDHYNQFWVSVFKNSPKEFEVTQCPRCRGTGKKFRMQTLEHPRLDPAAEDRVYIPYRLVAFPCKMAKCYTCNGTGRHVNPSIDAGGISDSQFRDDPDFRDEYFSGMYDVTCYGCKGKKTEPVIDRSAMCQEDTILYDAWRKRQDAIEKDYDDDQAERAAERRMGC